MLRALVAAIGKDFRLLARDRIGLVFLTIAPIIVITVAGFSLASLYGAGARGESAYLLPLADEDGGRVGRALREHLEAQDMVEVRVVPTRRDAEDLVRRKEAGVAVVVPAGASHALATGGEAEIEMLTDPVKYLEIANVRALVQEIRHGIERGAHEQAARRLAHLQAKIARARADFARAAASLNRELEALPARLASAETDARARARVAEAGAAKQVRTAIAETNRVQREIASARLTAELAPLRSFIRELETTQAAFTRWMASVRRQAGRYADRLPPPPELPGVPLAVSELLRLDSDTLIARLTSTTVPLPEIALPRVPVPPPPVLPTLDVPTFPAPTAVHLPGALEVAETSVTGAPTRLNTFDQNVPGFSVTFLLLGMLLGLSLGLLDERDWGTLDRLRSMPTPIDVTLLAKLVARFTVGFVQMAMLLLVGRIAFGISLGPEPLALALPTAGIVFAGTAFGLVVAGLAPSREAVLPLGSIVIVTMAAVGGCWWPIDLEPRWMQNAALAFPTTWAMAAYNDLMIRRQTVTAALRPTMILLLYGLAYLATGLALFRRRVAHG